MIVIFSQQNPKDYLNNKKKSIISIIIEILFSNLIYFSLVIKNKNLKINIKYFLLIN